MTSPASTGKPPWLKVRGPDSGVFQKTKRSIVGRSIVTVCEEASCPNIGDCWGRNHAAFMIMGAICTRACAFCHVQTGRPGSLDPTEPRRLAEIVAEMGLSHVVVTSVDRDDLPDGGAAHFAATIRAIRTKNPKTSIEILTPDFKHKREALKILEKAPPNVFNHNIETVPRLFPRIKRGGSYFVSLRLLNDAKKAMPNVFTKSGLIVGLGEEEGEVYQVMDDLREAGVDFLTMGQYLQPTSKHVPVAAYITPEQLKNTRKWPALKDFSWSLPLH